jgi:hypothetical protein
MPAVQLPECCDLAIARHLDTVDLSHWATSCHTTSRNSSATILGRHTMLPSLMILYVTAYLQHQAVARLTSAGLPLAYLLQDLLIPEGKEKFYQGRHNLVAYRRPPLLLRPLRLRAFFFAPYPQWSTLKWRTFMRVHVAGYRCGLDGQLSQWHKMTHLLDMAHKSHRLHSLLSSNVCIPGGHLSKYTWETELLRRLRDHNRSLSDLRHHRWKSTATSSNSGESSD